MAEFINADHDEIVLGPSTTMHVYLMAQALRHQFKAGDEIIVTEQDHEANVGAWRQLEEFGLVIREWQVDRETGALRYEHAGPAAVAAHQAGGFHPLLQRRLDRA